MPEVPTIEQMTQDLSSEGKRKIKQHLIPVIEEMKPLLTSLAQALKSDDAQQVEQAIAKIKQAVSQDNIQIIEVPPQAMEAGNPASLQILNGEWKLWISSDFFEKDKVEIAKELVHELGAKKIMTSLLEGGSLPTQGGEFEKLKLKLSVPSSDYALTHFLDAYLEKLLKADKE